MRNPMLGMLTLVLLLPGATASAQTSNAELMAPISTFLDTFNKGDMAGAAATHASGADLTIIDEVPPYLWRGPQAFQAWSGDLGSDATRRGVTGPTVAISPPTRVETSGDEAYVVVPAVYSYTLKGAAMHENAQMTFVLKKGAGGWLIHGWTWTGRKPMAGPARR